MTERETNIKVYEWTMMRMAAMPDEMKKRLIEKARVDHELPKNDTGDRMAIDEVLKDLNDDMLRNLRNLTVYPIVPE